MRNELYDKLLMEGITKIKGKLTKTELDEKKIEAFEKVLNETNGENLKKYYRNMDEFYGVNTDITLIDPRYLLTNEPHLCTGDDCNHELVGEVKEEKVENEDDEKEIVNIMEVKE